LDAAGKVTFATEALNHTADWGRDVEGKGVEVAGLIKLPKLLKVKAPLGMCGCQALFFSQKLLRERHRGP